MPEGTGLPPGPVQVPPTSGLPFNRGNNANVPSVLHTLNVLSRPAFGACITDRFTVDVAGKHGDRPVTV